jgi:hypothetical protein
LMYVKPRPFFTEFCICNSIRLALNPFGVKQT